MQPTQNLVTTEMVAPAMPIDLDEPVSRALRDAAKYLTRYGWVQGSYFDQSATVFTPAACAVGAIGMVCYGGPVEAPAQHFDEPGWSEFEATVAYLDRYLSATVGASCAYEFNDAPGRRVEDVLWTLSAAADEWDRMAALTACVSETVPTFGGVV